MMFSISRVEAGLIATVLLALIAGACGSSGGSGPAASPSAPAYSPTIEPASFTSQITNQLFPLTPGTTYVYEEMIEGTPQHDEIVVTYDTKTILGVTCVVVHDVVTSTAGEVLEDTFDWYAQDTAGNVWYFGEDTKEYENGKAKSTAGSWEAGVDGAQPGIIMEAAPRVGDSYRQEYYAGEAEDNASVTSLAGSIDVPFGSYTNAIITEETTALEPDVVEQKYNVPGVGFVYSTLTRGGSEEAKLVEVRTE
jgi:hypothetical protein